MLGRVRRADRPVAPSCCAEPKNRSRVLLENEKADHHGGYDTEQQRNDEKPVTTGSGRAVALIILNEGAEHLGAGAGVEVVVRHAQTLANSIPGKHGLTSHTLADPFPAPRPTPRQT